MRKRLKILVLILLIPFISWSQNGLIKDRYIFTGKQVKEIYKVKVQYEWFVNENETLRETLSYTDSINHYLEEKISLQTSQILLLKNLNTNSRKILEVQQKKCNELQKMIRKNTREKRLFSFTTVLAVAATIVLIFK